jgi:hypothetical protein
MTVAKRRKQEPGGGTLDESVSVFKKAYAGGFIPVVLFDLDALLKRRPARGRRSVTTNVTMVDLDFEVEQTFQPSQVQGLKKPPNANVVLYDLKNHPWAQTHQFFWRYRLEVAGVWGEWTEWSNILWANAPIWQPVIVKGKRARGANRSSARSSSKRASSKRASASRSRPAGARVAAAGRRR